MCGRSGDFIDRVRPEQPGKRRITEQGGECCAIKLERLQGALSLWRVPLVHVLLVEIEVQRLGDRGRRLAGEGFYIDLARLHPVDDPFQRRHVHLVFQHVAVSLEEDREVGDVAGHREQVTGAQALQVKGRSSAPGTAGQQKRARRVLPESSAEHSRVHQPGQHPFPRLRRVHLRQDVIRQRRIRFRHA